MDKPKSPPAAALPCWLSSRGDGGDGAPSPGLSSAHTVPFPSRKMPVRPGGLRWGSGSRDGEGSFIPILLLSRLR